MRYAKDIYEAFVEVEVTAQSELSKNSSGAFVSCYIPAADIEQAIFLLKGKVCDDKFNLIDIQQIVRISIDEWEPYDPDFPTTDALKEALDEEKIIYGPFDSYESCYEH